MPWRWAADHPAAIRQYRIEERKDHTQKMQFKRENRRKNKNANSSLRGVYEEACLSISNGLDSVRVVSPSAPTDDIGFSVPNGDTVAHWETTFQISTIIGTLPAWGASKRL